VRIQLVGHGSEATDFILEGDIMAYALRATDLTVRYGGVLALNRVDLSVEVGSITGLIGPNGAGKSTFFKACEGSIRNSDGHLELFGRDVSRLGPVRRARLGLGRTYQQVQLFDSMSVRRNIALGYEAGQSWHHAWGLFSSSPTQRAAAVEVAENLIDLCGLHDVSRQLVGTLSTGQKRMVELARALASPARLLLMDEPSSGLDRHESEFFASTVKSAVLETGQTVVLVEHDMDLVADLCDQVYVLNFGNLIFSGSMSDALVSPEVRESYLGVTTPRPSRAPEGEVPGA
jgi:ABC-type branched-subunit amino acid transport system ATPase component